MITNPIVHPKIAILASVAVGALTIAVLALRPDTGGLPVDPSGFRQGDASSAGAPDHPRPTALASGKVTAQNQADAHVTQVLDAVRASLNHGDLASARVLLGALGAERALYRDDPRVMALQRELQAREQASGEARAVEPSASAASAASSRSGRAVRYAGRYEHRYGASWRTAGRTGTSPDYVANARVPQTGAVAAPAAMRPAPSVVPANAEVNFAPRLTSPSEAQAPSPAPAPALAQASQSGQEVQGAQGVQKAQSVPAWTPPSSSVAQEPKTRAEVRMELEQARADGALPRFGNPDPAGPGGASSRVTHPLVVNW